MIVIFGGTGTLGNALTKEILEKYCSETIVIVSRCELKQKQMADKFNSKQLRFIVGDVRDHHWSSMIKIDEQSLVFNLAAMKHVEVAEENIEYCYDVNVNGTLNTLDWCDKYGASYMFSSTDKAVLPINSYGASKMMAEKMVLSRGHHVFRWGNVLGSRGSVLGIFRETLLKFKTIYITHKEMTRFWVLIQDVAKFMIEKSELTGNQVFIPEMRAAPLLSLAECVAKILEIKDYKIIETGIRAGEKIHECLWSSHDNCLRSDHRSIWYSQDELLKLVEKAIEYC